jgi:hypothetical protein
MLHADPMMRRVSVIIDGVVEAGLHNYWISVHMHLLKIYSRKMAFVKLLDVYYSFSLLHIQPAFYLLLMGWCVSALCFMVEVLYSHVLSKTQYMYIYIYIYIIMGYLLHIF